MKSASIRRASMDAIVAQGEREFPFECCGFIIGDNENAVEEVRPIATSRCDARQRSGEHIPA